MGLDTAVIPIVQQGAAVSAALLGTSGTIILHNVGNWIMNLVSRQALDGTPVERALRPFAGSSVAVRTRMKAGGSRTRTKTQGKFMKLRHVCRDRQGHRIPCTKKRMKQY